MLFENIDDSYLKMFLSNDKNNNIASDDGFLKGNMFEDEFVPYKNMKYIKPELKGQREKDLFEIMKTSFEINDYNLFLDLHPENVNIFNKYKIACEKLNKQVNEYEKKYGQLCLENGNNFDSFKWVNNPWPWEWEDSKYV